LFDVNFSLRVQLCECANVRVTQTFPVFRSHLIILCAVNVPYAEDPQISLATLHNVFTRATGHLKCVHLCSHLPLKKCGFFAVKCYRLYINHLGVTVIAAFANSQMCLLASSCPFVRLSARINSTPTELLVFRYLSL
jgi:hypothetical protein